MISTKLQANCTIISFVHKSIHLKRHNMGTIQYLYIACDIKELCISIGNSRAASLVFSESEQEKTKTVLYAIILSQTSPCLDSSVIKHSACMPKDKCTCCDQLINLSPAELNHTDPDASCVYCILICLRQNVVNTCLYRSMVFPLCCCPSAFFPEAYYWVEM